jgi:hypothetical protein
MAIPLVGGPAPSINHRDLLTGDSSHFKAGVGNWTASGATLTYDSTIAYMWPSNNTGSAKLATSGASQRMECPVPGTFKSGVEYQAWVLLTVEENVACDFVLTLGVQGVDVGTFTAVSFGAEEPWNDGRYTAFVVRWRPTATRTGVTIRMNRTEASGTINYHIGHCKVFRPIVDSTITALATPSTTAAAPPSGMAPVFETQAQGWRLHAGSKFNGGFEVDSFAGASMEANTDGDTALDYSGIGVYPGNAWIQAGTVAGIGDMTGQGINFEAGDDYVGINIGEKDSDTVQLYADSNSGYQVELRDRGGKGWSNNVGDGVQGKVSDSFQWPFYVAGVQTTGTDKAAYWQTPAKCIIDEVRIHLGTAPTGAPVIVDVNDDGTTIFTTQANRPITGITVKNVTSGSDSTDGNFYNTASVTLKAGRLYLMSVELSHASSAPLITAIQSTPMSGVSMTSRSTTTFNGGLNRTSIWSYVPTRDWTTALFFNIAASVTGIAWSLDEVTGVDTTTNDGVVQQAVGTGTSTTPLATLAAFGSVENGAYAAHGQAAAAATTPGSGWTELADVTAATPPQALETAYRFDNDTTADATITSAAWGSCAIELKGDSANVTSRSPDGGTAVAKNSVLTIDVDQIGSGTAGSDLAVFVRGRYIW